VILRRIRPNLSVLAAQPPWPDLHVRRRNIRLKLALLDAGLLQIELAQQLGRDPAWVSRLLNGWIEPSYADRQEIASFLRRDESEIFTVSGVTPAGNHGEARRGEPAPKTLAPTG
jgi:transcriptional regulator with XRE-family HTH domain